MLAARVRPAVLVVKCFREESPKCFPINGGSGHDLDEEDELNDDEEDEKDDVEQKAATIAATSCHIFRSMGN